MTLLYNVFIQLYGLGIRLAALWNKKAAAWVEGRKDVFTKLQKQLPTNGRFIWMHCASAGEFEQGKPLIEALKKTYPEKKILVSFFSPSGYGVAKNYTGVDAITYLPLDTKANAQWFYDLVNPEMIIFIKYEFWYHHLAVADLRRVPVLLASAVFRENQVFFKPYGGFFRRMLPLFTHIFVQDKTSLQLLQSIGVTRCSVSGDTRFDRVQAIVDDKSNIPFLDQFIAGKKVIVAGSTWPGDEEVLVNYLKQKKDVKLVLAPHEINREHIQSIQTLFENSILYSELKKGEASDSIGPAQTLIVDSVGLLSRLYRYATITYVGGGFTKDGIHNILEAAVWQKPVLFGPNYKKYREGSEMIDAGGAVSFSDAESFKRLADDLLTNEDHLQDVSLRAKAYINENTGATQRIVKAIQEKRLLTN